MKSTYNKRNHLAVNANNEASYSNDNNFVSVNSIWICRNQCIIAESQIGSKSNNKKEKKFVKVFLEQIIQPSKQSNKSSKLAKSPSFSIYVKKRKYLFHVLFDKDLTLLSLTTNTLHQQPLQEIFDLLYAVKSAFLYEDNLTFNDTLTDLHHSYQFKCTSKILYNNKSFISHSDDSCDNEAFDMLYGQYSPSPKDIPNIRYNHSNHSRTTKFSNDTLNLSALASPIPSLNDTSASPSYSNNPCPFSDTPSDTHSHEGDNDDNDDNGDGDDDRTVSNKSNKSSESNNTFKIHFEECKEDDDDDEIEELEYFILKKGWMSKLGVRFKTWKFRYFELWSNGLLNYFDNEMKIKKKGSLNIVDEVVTVQLYSKSNKDSKGKEGEYGFMLSTHSREYCFVLQKENVRNDWYLLIQTITFNKKIDLNMKFKTLKLRLEKLEFKWERKFRNIESDMINGEGYAFNIYELQHDLNCAMNSCQKCKKEIVYFCGSDTFTLFTSKVDYISSNIERILETINTIIHSRNETPFRKRKRNNNKWYTKRNRKSLKENNSNSSSNSKSSNSKSSNSNSKSCLKFEDSQIVLKDKIKIRLPSKKLIRSKNALSKKIKLLNVIVYGEYFKVDVNRENTAPLIWRFDEILKVKDIKGVYYGKKRTEKVNLSDIQQFQITIFHQSNRRAQLLFDNEKDAFLWYTKLKSLYDKANIVHIPLYYGHETNHEQIGL